MTMPFINSRDYLAVFLKNKNCIYDEYLGFTEKFCDKGYKVYKKKKAYAAKVFMCKYKIEHKKLMVTQNIINEIINYQQLSHPSITKFIGFSCKNLSFSRRSLAALILSIKIS